MTNQSPVSPTEPRNIWMRGLFIHAPAQLKAATPPARGLRACEPQASTARFAVS